MFIGNDTGKHSGRVKVKLNKGKGKAVRNLKSEDYYTAGADDNGTTVNFRGGEKSGITSKQKEEIYDFVIRNAESLKLNKEGKISDDEFVNAVLQTERDYYNKSIKGKVK